MEDVAGYIRALSESGGQVDYSFLLQRGREAVRSEIWALWAPALALLAAMLFRGFNDHLGGAGRGAGIVCCAAGASALMGWFSLCAEDAARAARRLAELTESLTPILTGLLTALGAENGSAAFSVLAGLCQGAAGIALNGAVPGLCCASAALAAAGSLHEKLRLKKLSALLANWATAVSGALVSAFLGAAALSGALAGARDGIALRTARYAVDSLFPAVGGELSDALGAAAGGGAALHSAVGVTGAVLLLGVCLRPLARLMLSLMACRLAAALAEPVSDSGMADMADGFARAFRGLLASLACAAALTLIWIGAGLSLAQTAVGAG